MEGSNAYKVQVKCVDAVAVRSCGRSSPIAFAFEPVVEINPLLRDTGPQFNYPRIYLGTHLSTNPFRKMNSCVSCAMTVLELGPADS